MFSTHIKTKSIALLVLSASLLSSNAFADFNSVRNIPGIKASGEFDTPTSNDLRQRLKGTVVHRTTGSSSGGIYSSSSTTLNFCSDGTFHAQESSNVSGSSSGISINSNARPITYSGSWETFKDKVNGMMGIALYSQNPYVLKLSPKGVIPLYVKSYNTGVISIYMNNKPAPFRWNISSICK